MPFLIVVNFFEILSAITGSYKMKKYRVPSETRYFIFFLWITVFVEVIFGWIPWFVYSLDSLSEYKDSFLGNNHWAYNIYFIFSFIFYINYFKLYYKSKKFISISNIISILYLIFSLASLLFDTYIEGISPFVYIAGSLLLSLSVILYFLEIINSDRILNFYRFFPFYVAIGALLFHLAVTPMFIYSEYYSKEYPNFVEIRKIILYGSNIFLYSCYTLGFILCYRKNKFY